MEQSSAPAAGAALPRSKAGLLPYGCLAGTRPPAAGRHGHVPQLFVTETATGRAALRPGSQGPSRAAGSCCRR